jgi:signal transduction histidine kinase
VSSHNRTPLTRPRTYGALAAAWCHAAVGAGLGALVLPFSLCATLPPAEPRSLRLVLWPAATLLLVALAGLDRTSRRAAIHLTNRLLHTHLPVPPGRTASAATGTAAGVAVSGTAGSVGSGARPGWGDRVRSGGWWVVQVVAGGLLMGVTFLLVGIAVALPVLWARGGAGGAITYVGVAVPARGWAGLVTVPVAAAHLALAVLACAGYRALLRWLAPALLGPGTAERLAAERRRADELAHRNRLARELHDSIGHTLTASTLQAAAAGRLLDTAPDPDPRLVRQTLTTIEESSRTALEDLDHALATLRTSPAGAPAHPAGRTLADLPGLFDRMRTAGTPVDAMVTGDLTAVPHPVSREAYRIVQEALTNALRHGAPGTIHLTLGVEQDRLLIEVLNPVPADGPAGRTGRGLAGVAERVHVLRGGIEVGPIDATDDLDADHGGGGEGGAVGRVGGRSGWWRLVVWLPVRGE